MACEVAMLTAHALSPEALQKSHDMGARAYLPKEKLGEIVPFLENVLRYDFKPGWKHLLDSLEDFLTDTFDWESARASPGKSGSRIGTNNSGRIRSWIAVGLPSYCTSD